MIFEVPLLPQAQKLTVQLGEKIYNLRLTWIDVPMGGWILDISDQNDEPVLHGVPLGAGVDLLAQYDYLEFGGRLFVGTDGDVNEPPQYDNLGVTAHLFFEPK